MRTSGLQGITLAVGQQQQDNFVLLGPSWGDLGHRVRAAHQQHLRELVIGAQQPSR